MQMFAQSPHPGGRRIARWRQLPPIRDLGAALALFWIVVFAGSAGADTPVASSFAGGDGSEANPFQISTLAELRLFMQGPLFPNALSPNQNNFKLIATINAADTSTWLGGLGWQPVAWTPLNSFDGQNFEIQNLTINRPTQDSVGFISTLGGSCCDQVLKNIKLVGGTIAGHDNTGGIAGQTGQFMMPMTNLSSTAAVSGNSMVGGLIGATSGSTLTNSSAGGSVTGMGFGAGGLVGSAGGTSISSTHATGHVTGKGQVGGLIGIYTQGVSGATPLTTSWASGQVDGDERVGGLLGTSTGKVTFSFAMGAVTATGLNPQVPGSSQVGGLIGNVTGNQDTYATEDCYATGSVTAPLRSIGGLIGSNSGSISRCSTSAAQTVTGTGASSGAVGGLVGSSNGTINSSRAAGTVNVSGTATNVGGLAGEHVVAANITSSYATGNVSAANATSVGGLIGSHSGGTVNGAHATGNVMGGAQYVGGLIGFSTTPGITNSYATGTVSGGAFVGGLIGDKTGGTVNTAFATGSVTGTGDYVGGLIGFSSASSVTKTWAKPGAVSGQNWVGGLIGIHSGSLTLSFAANNVSGSGTFYVGGLVGEISSNVFTLSDCYAKGTVTGSTYTGGLAGKNDSNNNVARCYASGAVNGSATTNGAFIGDNERPGISNNFWNADTAAPQPGFGSASSFPTGATGLTSAQMKQQAQFTTFDFSTVWGITEGTTEPYLLWAGVAAGPATTNTVLLSTANPSVPGQSVVFAAIVNNGNAPTGTVVFQLGNNPISGCTAVPVSSGQAQCAVSGLALGSNSISAVYSGDFNNTGSTSSTLNQLVVPPSLDADYSVTQTKYDALTDGLLIVRYMYNMVNNSLTAGVLGPTAGRTNPADVKNYLDAIRPLLDIDGNGVVDPATDGVLIMRYLLGVRGDKLIDSAVDLQNGTRKTSNDIETYIQTLMP